MIEHLDRTYESVHFRENAHIRMYNNIQAEAYPPHWHNETEIILVRSGKLHVRCGGEDYFLQAGDILLICPSSIHEIFKESTGSRCYLLVDLYGLSVLQELKTAFSLLVPAVLISRQTIPNGFSYFQELFRNIYNLYFGDSIFEMNFEALDPENVYSIDRNSAAMSLPFMNETQIYSILLDFVASLAKEVQTAAQKKAPPKKIVPAQESWSGTIRQFNRHATLFYQSLQSPLVLTLFPKGLGSVNIILNEFLNRSCI